MRVVVLLSESEGERFESFCLETGHKKSPLIARLIREHLDHEGYASQRTMFQPNATTGHARKGSKARTERNND